MMRWYSAPCRNRAEIEDDFIDMEAMRDIDRHEAEIYSSFEGEGERDIYYTISLTSDAFADSYYLSVMDGNTEEEVQAYRDSYGDMPTFETVDEAVDYCRRKGVEFQNEEELDEWRAIDAERAEKPLTADDIQNLVLTGREYFAGSRTTVYDFECDIRGEHDFLQYTLEYHDDGEGFTIHTEKDDIWERMSEPELEHLEGILSREAVYFKYHEKITGAESLEDLKEIEYEIMEDESPYFPAVSERVWKAFSQKEHELSVPEQETSGYDVQKLDYRVGVTVYLDNKPYEITRTDDWNVEIMDRSLFNPPRCLESRENFEKLLRQDKRNAHLFMPEKKSLASRVTQLKR